MLRSRQPLLLASAMQMIASFHAENWQEIAEEEERKLDAEWPVLPESEKWHARQAQECVQPFFEQFPFCLEKPACGSWEHII